MKRKGSHSTDAKPISGSPEISHSALKPPLAVANVKTSLEGSAIVDTPHKEETNPLDSASQNAKNVSPIPEEK